MKYSIKRGISKVIKGMIIFALPVLANEFIIEYPQIAQLTVGGLLLGLVNLIKIKLGARAKFL